MPQEKAAALDGLSHKASGLFWILGGIFDETIAVFCGDLRLCCGADVRLRPGSGRAKRQRSLF